jgi:UDP-N-acetylenolpyruvoylglucosamine reductase
MSLNGVKSNFENLKKFMESKEMIDTRQEILKKSGCFFKNKEAFEKTKLNKVELEGKFQSAQQELENAKEKDLKIHGTNRKYRY